MGRSIFRTSETQSHQSPLMYIARTWRRVTNARPIMANNNHNPLTPSSQQTSDPFHALPTELLASILDHLTARERCYLRLQSTHIRRFVDKYEEAKSISLYARDSARTRQPWDPVLSLVRIDLRAELSRLACDYALLSTRCGDYHYIAQIVAKTLYDLSSETALDIRVPAPASVIHAVLDMHHVQRLLADEERRGLRLDEKLIAAQKAIRARLISIYGLQKDVVWPTDTAIGYSTRKKRRARAEIEEIIEQ